MMNPFSPYNPWYPYPFPASARARRVDVNGIYELSTNAVEVSETSADYGICPTAYNALPCESVVLLKIHAAVPESGASLPITIATPGASTTGTAKTKVSVVDASGTAVTGSSVTDATESLAYINKRSGIIRLLGFQQPTATATSKV